MKKNKQIFIYIALAAILLYACQTPQKLVQIRELAKIYNPGQTHLHPQFNIIHTDSVISNLIVKIFPNELLFNNANTDLELRAELLIKYTVVTVKDNQTIPYDTGSFTYQLQKNQIKDRFFAQIPFKASLGQLYNIKVTITDLNRQSSYTNYLTVDKKTRYSSQNFMIIDQEDHYPLSPPYTIANKLVRIKYTYDIPDSIFISFFKFNPNAPKITNAINHHPEEPDSILHVPFSEQTPFALYNEGIYFFQIDTAFQEGLTLLNLGQYYPKILHNSQMLPPLQYITNNFEYLNLKNQKNQKLALDNFWLSKTSNIERAREMIRIYYNRVYFSNYYFTSDRDGWKTDRGMVYIVYGPPEAIYKTPVSEEWLYFRGTKTEPVKFVFYLNNNPYTLNDYKLNRAESNTAEWRKAQQQWQTGSLFYMADN